MTVKNLIDRLKTFPPDANVEVIIGQELNNNWPIDRVGVLYDESATAVIVAKDGRYGEIRLPKRTNGFSPSHWKFRQRAQNGPGKDHACNGDICGKEVHHC